MWLVIIPHYPEAYSSRIDPGKLVTIGVDHVRVVDRIYNPVRMGDVFGMLARPV